MSGFTPSEVADRLEIADVLTKYVHAVDDEQFDELDEVFLPETIFDMTSAGGGAAGGQELTWAEMRKRYEQDAIELPHIFHLYANSRIRFTADGTGATVKTKVIHPVGALDGDGTEHLFQVQGAYEDQFAKTPAGWRILRRRWVGGFAIGDEPQR